MMTNLSHSTLKTIGRLVSAAAFLSLGAVAPAATSFEGAWSVLIITESGTCDPAYRYPVRVANGAVLYQGDAAVSVSGSVDNNGLVKVVIAHGQQRADGSGRLNATGGGGTWAGSSTSTRCHGRWQAERR
jgi:hypothetical protein